MVRDRRLRPREGVAQGPQVWWPLQAVPFPVVCAHWEWNVDGRRAQGFSSGFSFLGPPATGPPPCPGCGTVKHPKRQGVDRASISPRLTGMCCSRDLFTVDHVYVNRFSFYRGGIGFLGTCLWSAAMDILLVPWSSLWWPLSNTDQNKERNHSLEDRAANIFQTWKTLFKKKDCFSKTKLSILLCVWKFVWYRNSVSIF